MYKIFMVVGLIVVGLGWMAYGVYWYLVVRKRQKHPRPSERLEEARKQMAEYAKKVADYKRKRYERQE